MHRFRHSRRSLGRTSLLHETDGFGNLTLPRFRGTARHKLLFKILLPRLKIQLMKFRHQYRITLDSQPSINIQPGWGLLRHGMATYPVDILSPPGNPPSAEDAFHLDLIAITDNPFEPGLFPSGLALFLEDGNGLKAGDTREVTGIECL
jgi:hypothetical protein